MEKVVVRELLSPPPDLTFADQFAFQPSGSTTAALVYLLRTISQLLTVNPYVIVIALDYSKAFDTVRHSGLLKKFAMLDLPDNVYNWLVDYFEDHSHCTSYQGETSKLLHISASNIQGSGVGPAAYIVQMRSEGGAGRIRRHLL